MTSEYAEPFNHGHLAGDLANNPHLSTSNHSDAFVLGVWFANRSFPRTDDIRKSRGYEWIVAGRRYRVDGDKVTPMGPVTMATTGRKRSAKEPKSICGLPLFEPPLL